MGPAGFFWYFLKKHYGSLLLPKPIDPRVAVLEAVGNGFLLEYHGSTTDRQAPIGNFASRVNLNLNAARFPAGCNAEERKWLLSGCSRKVT